MLQFFNLQNPTQKHTHTPKHTPYHTNAQMGKCSKGIIDRCNALNRKIQSNYQLNTLSLDKAMLQCFIFLFLFFFRPAAMIKMAVNLANKNKQKRKKTTCLPVDSKQINKQTNK